MDLDLFSIDKKNNYWETLRPFLHSQVRSIKRCFDFSCQAHQGQKRMSGLDYISHPVWVAKVVAQMKVGPEAVKVALLHDCVEDTEITIEQIADNFGDEVALLVEGLTEVRKKTKGINVRRTDIEVFKRFLFSSVDDVRILIVRLVDKLHNGLTIKYLPRARQKKYARRVFGIYAPVAEYVGMHYFKKRLDDIAFEILYPKKSKKLKGSLKKAEKGELMALQAVSVDVQKMIEMNRLKDVEVCGRIKSLYSTYCKMKRKGEEGVKDRVGIRILSQSVADCYTMLGLLHAKYPYLDDEFDDYISAPKANGYRSLQTALKWKGGLTVEVQIRTFAMHEFNEFGPASHVAYKYGLEKGAGFEWVKDLVKWQNNEKGVSNYRIKVLTNYIYVFTPKSDTIQLPAGSCGLDFAYRIHSGLGNCCKGVKINEKMVKLGTKLKTGDVVEILRGKKINASSDWLTLAKTASARAHIRRAISGV